MGLTASFLSAAQKAMFNSSEWTPVGKPVPLKEIWDQVSPGLYEEVDGEVATVTSVTFKDGSTGYRISVPIKDSDPIELNLSAKSDLTEGDEVLISSIYGQELKKAGQPNIVRYDGELYEGDEDEEPEPEPEPVKPKRRNTRSK